jgi:hypothetical protein
MIITGEMISLLRSAPWSQPVTIPCNEPVEDITDAGRYNHQRIKQRPSTAHISENAQNG